MTNSKFDIVAKDQLKNCKNILTLKSGTYAPMSDRLLCFKKAAAMMQSTPKLALWGMLIKHLVSISDMITSDKEFDIDIWNEKITDAMNYLILLKALVIEEKEI